MSAWIGIAISVIGLLIVEYRHTQNVERERGRVDAEMDAMKSAIAKLETTAQTPGERERIAAVLQAEFNAHRREDDLRFGQVKEAIESLKNMQQVYFDKILDAVSNNGARGHTA